MSGFCDNPHIYRVYCVRGYLAGMEKDMMGIDVKNNMNGKHENSVR